MSDRIKSYKDFWPFYLREHSKPATRTIHLAGTGTAVALMGTAVVTGQWWLPLAGVAAGYGSAWTAHAFIEKNKPATFKYPLWSLISDFKMLGHYLTGTLQREVDKHVGPPKAENAPAAAAPGKSLMQRARGLTQRFRQTVAPRADSTPPAPKAKPQPPQP